MYLIPVPDNQQIKMSTRQIAELTGKNKGLEFSVSELKEKNSSLTDRYTKLDESYNAMLKRNRNV